MKVSAVIPARWASQRLPGKVLVDLGGRPLLWHTWDRVRQMEFADEVVVAVDDKQVQKAVEGWGGRAIMTDPNCISGTERIASIVDQLKGDFILNVQADQCFIETYLLDEMVSCWKETEGHIITPVYRIMRMEDLLNPSVVKAVINGKGKALYFSRSPIPCVRDVAQEEWLHKHPFWWHYGVYGYARGVLKKYFDLPESILEKIEMLEQLRFLEAGYCIQTLETKHNSIEVNTPEDLIVARKFVCELV